VAGEVVLIDPLTGDAYRAGGGSGGGGGDASASNQTIEIARLTSIRDSLPVSPGQKTMAASLPVTLASDGVVGAVGDAVATSDTGAFSLISLEKRSLGYLSTLATAAMKPTAGTNLSGTATTTSGGFSIPANANRKPGDVQGQNISTVNIGFNEFGGAAAIGTAGTYTVAPGATFAITTTNAVAFIAASGTAPVTITGL